MTLEDRLGGQAGISGVPFGRSAFDGSGFSFPECMLLVTGCILAAIYILKAIDMIDSWKVARVVRVRL